MRHQGTSGQSLGQRELASKCKEGTSKAEWRSCAEGIQTNIGSPREASWSARTPVPLSRSDGLRSSRLDRSWLHPLSITLLASPALLTSRASSKTTTTPWRRARLIQRQLVSLTRTDPDGFLNLMLPIFTENNLHGHPAKCNVEAERVGRLHRRARSRWPVSRKALCSHVTTV